MPPITWQNSVMDILQPKAANDQQRQRDDNTSGHLTPSLKYQELASIIISLTHTLEGLRQETNELKLQVTEAQNRCKEPDRMAKKEITSLQEALTAARYREQLRKATRQDLKRELFYTKDTSTKVLEGYLYAARAEIQTLTQQFCSIKEVLDMVQNELKQSYSLQMDSPSKRHPAAHHTASSSPSSLNTKPSAEHYQFPENLGSLRRKMIHSGQP
ncbi:Golgin subfamily A member 6B [Labeo rohita]|uniref:Golgin subfamily A member 6B n=1 Tax=Labeo rohita TaxID=84645 RepID=A0ABQ8L152_LABRO|nr:Golgin subfamily A member 6B [Labeo rohita]